MDSAIDYDKSEKNNNRPPPTDFDAFLPWACGQYRVDATIDITRTEQGKYNTSLLADKRGQKLSKIKEEATNVDIKEIVSTSTVVRKIVEHDPVVHIETVYDQNEHLVQLKFLKNDIVPRTLLKVILLVLPFHPHLASIHINRGLRYGTMHELIKIASLTKITELILDNTALLQANYHLLLENNNSLMYLSLARCQLDDKAVKAIASKLMTSSLSILNLTSNKITDVGATSLGTALRSNRKLSYLNVADNMITDIGAASILNSLNEFPLNPNEIMEKKGRCIAYCKEKQELVNTIFEDLRTACNNNSISPVLNNSRTTYTDKKIVKRKPTKLTSDSLRKSKDGSFSNLLGSETNFETILMERAETKAKDLLGPFQDAFSSDNTTARDGVMYCLGNNTLCHLNLAYNNLSYFSVKKLYEVIYAQENCGRKPRGLVNVCIEGNNIPDACEELTEIDFILQSSLATAMKISTVMKKKSVKGMK